VSSVAAATGAFLVKRWEVSVLWSSGTITRGNCIASTRGKALADTWRSDAFSGSTFGEFLRFASCRRDPVAPPRWGDPITVLNKPAFFLGNNRQYVQFVYADATVTLNAHPYDVLPVEYRPDTYRDR
jgi:hypothetical protein